MKNKILLLAFIACILFPRTRASAKEITAVLNPNPLQGDTVVVKILDKNLSIQSALFDGQPIPFFSYKNSYRAVFGIPATKTAGSYRLKIDFQNGETFEKEINVRPRKFQKVVLGIPKELNLTPKKLVEKLQTEKVSLDTILQKRTETIFFDRSFGLPLADNRRIGSPFGEIRKTGEEEIRHLGIDFTGRMGAAVGAINAGIVRKAYSDTVYGNSVIVDHGQGIFSLYLHLNEIKAKEGDTLKQGALVGTVGQSGYATLPHLHLSLKIGGVSVDPIRFVANFK